MEAGSITLGWTSSNSLCSQDERAKYFKSDLPTSALIGVVPLAHPDLMVELEVMAVIPTERFKPQE